MKQIKLYGIHNASKTAIESGKTDLLYPLQVYIDVEWIKGTKAHKV